LIYGSGNNATDIIHFAKLPMLLFFILSAILIFRWAHELYGDFAAFLSLILFTFSSTVLAHSRFVTTDVAALFGILYSAYFFLKYLKSPTKKHFFLAAIFFGIALLTKFSTFLIAPFFVLTALIYGFGHGVGTFSDKSRQAVKEILRTVAVFAVGFVIIVWPVYYLHTHNYPPQRQHRDTEIILSSFGNRYMADPVVWMSDKPVLRAAGHYGLGLLMVTQRSAGGNTTYFLGEVSRFGWHHYFPVVYFIKEPLAWWGMVLIALLYFAWQCRKPTLRSFSPSANLKSLRKFAKNHLAEFAMLLWLLIYWTFSIRSTLNIGVRHLLPVYPFTIILISGQLHRIGYKLQTGGFKLRNFVTIYSLAIAALVGWYVYENLHVFPYYLTYFNQTAGGPAGGYRYVVDSNLDWGQDLVRFSDWVKENNIPKIEVDYFGWADPVYYLSSRYERLWSTKYQSAQDFISRNNTDGWLAVSATFLQGSQGSEDMPNPINYLWLNAYEPVTIIGNSIFIYQIK